MLHRKVLEPRALDLLKELMGLSSLESFLLVGGTALALRYGHRISVDLDLFGKVNNLDYDWINAEVEKLGEVVLATNSKVMLGYYIHGIKVNIVKYPYTFIRPIHKIEGIRFASNEDIAAMKFASITGRGKKKDFYDLFFLLKEFTFKKMFDFYDQKYPDGNRFLVMRSITYFEDAEADQDPFVFEDLSWSEVKKTIQAKYYQYLKTT